LAIVLIATKSYAQTWDSVCTLRLNDSSSYLESKLNLKTAEIDYDQYVKPYIPSVSLTTYSNSSTGYVSGINFGSDTSSGGTLIPTVTFEKIFVGSDLSFQAPVVFSSTSDVSLGNPSISLSRSLFPETEANRLDAEASLLSAQASIQKIQNDLRISLATDILSTIYYQKLLETSQKNLEVLKKVREATVDTTKFNELNKSVLKAQKAILEATDYLADIKDDVKNNAKALYEDFARLKDVWLASIKGGQPTTSKSIRSIELSLAAAEKREKLSIVSFLPNPTLTASVYYDVNKNKLGWGVGFKMSYTMLNKGQNSLNALKREEYPKIYKIKLEDAQKELNDNLRKISEELRSLELDKKIKSIEIADAQDKAVKQENLYKSGFVSKEDYMTAQIDLETLQLDSQKIDSDILIQRLKLARYYDEAK
jgi:outer membrane protein TolC